MTQVRLTAKRVTEVVVRKALWQAERLAPGTKLITRLGLAKQRHHLNQLRKRRRNWTPEERAAWREKMGLPPRKPKIKFGQGSANRSRRKVSLPGSKFLEQDD